jgi:hypothetical protein
MCDSGKGKDADTLQNVREIQRHLRELENQFDDAQGNLRTAGSVWTLAGVGGLAGAMALDIPAKGIPMIVYLHDHPAALMSFVCFLVVFGLANLWSVDQFVYQRLLHAAYGYGMILEDYLEPPERMRQLINHHVSDVTGPLSTFYLIPILLFLTLFAILNVAQSWNGFACLDVIPWVLWGGCAFYSAQLYCKSRADDVTAARKSIEDELKEKWKRPAREITDAPPAPTP